MNAVPLCKWRCETPLCRYWKSLPTKGTLSGWDSNPRPIVFYRIIDICCMFPYVLQRYIFFLKIPNFYLFFLTNFYSISTLRASNKLSNVCFPSIWLYTIWTFFLLNVSIVIFQHWAATIALNYISFNFTYHTLYILGVKVGVEPTSQEPQSLILPLNYITHVKKRTVNIWAYHNVYLQLLLN